jgi:hypothetical protein
MDPVMRPSTRRARRGGLGYGVAGCGAVSARSVVKLRRTVDKLGLKGFLGGDMVIPGARGFAARV